MTWRYHTPERDGHAPVDWVPGMETEIWDYDDWIKATLNPRWNVGNKYRYRPLQDAAIEIEWDAFGSDKANRLFRECLALPQDQQEALIEAMQKPQRDWADDVADTLWYEWEDDREATLRDMAAVIRSMCRPKEELQHVAYYDEGQFHWMSGIAPRDCELFAKRKDCA